jgi:hypothetical protein
VAPSVLGNAIAVALLIERAEDRSAGVAAGTALALGGVAVPFALMFVPTEHELYRAQLADAQIEIAVLPTLGGATVRGSV